MCNTEVSKVTLFKGGGYDESAYFLVLRDHQTERLLFVLLHFCLVPRLVLGGKGLVLFLVGQLAPPGAQLLADLRHAPVWVGLHDGRTLVFAKEHKGGPERIETIFG